MPIITVHLETPIRRTFRVEQIAGMLDVPLEERIGHSLTAEVPGLDEPWMIGAIVGPSGSGKTTLARAAFVDAVCEAREWARERAIVEVLGESVVGTLRVPSAGNGTRSVPTTIKEITRVLVAVGLGNVVTWLKPYHVLSTGERFRADVARAVLGARRQGAGDRGRGSAPGVPSALGNHERSPSVPGPCSPSPLVVVDEFTSALDRAVAATVSLALARLVRGERGLRFVAVTCQADVLPFLSPDWVVRLAADGQAALTRSRQVGTTLSPRERAFDAGPTIKVDRVPQAMWGRFKKHHYLAGGLARSATCYGAWIQVESQRSLVEGDDASETCDLRHSTFDNFDAPIAFCAVVAALGWKKTKRITRLVVLPEFQGLGLGMLLAQEVAAREQRKGNRVTITASHPAIVAHCSRSPWWRYLGLKKTGSTRQRMGGREIASSRGRAVASFEFVGE